MTANRRRAGASSKVVEAVVERLKARTIKLVLITNASQLHREAVIRGVSQITASGGEVWGKLDAGTEAYYQAVNRCATPFSRILDNLSVEARRYPIVIQSLFLRLRGEAPDEREIGAYCKRLGEITESGGRIDRVQIHTIAQAAGGIVRRAPRDAGSGGDRPGSTAVYRANDRGSWRALNRRARIDGSAFSLTPDWRYDERDHDQDSQAKERRLCPC